MHSRRWLHFYTHRQSHMRTPVLGLDALGLVIGLGLLQLLLEELLGVCPHWRRGSFWQLQQRRQELPRELLG